MTRTRLALGLASRSCAAVWSLAVVAPVDVGRFLTRQRSSIGIAPARWPAADAVRPAAIAACACIVTAWSAMLPSECLGAVTELVSVDRATGNAAGSSLEPSISGDGRYVVFSSASARLVPGDTNAAADIFVRDRQTGLITRVSRNSSGQQANGASGRPAISLNGRYVAFGSNATNLTPESLRGVFVHDRETGATEHVTSVFAAATLALSADGRYLTILSLRPDVDLQVIYDLSVWDRRLDVREVIATGSRYRNAIFGAAFSGNGRYVAYAARGPGVIVYDRLTRLRERVDLNSNEEPGNHLATQLSISRDGRYVAFTSYATNLAASDSNGVSDVFVRDREAGTTTRVSVGPGARQADGNSYGPSISAYGRYVAFVSDAGNLVSSDQNGVADIFLRDRQTGVTQLLSVNSNGKQGDLASESPAINAGGRYVAFASSASDLVSNDFNTSRDVFVRDRGGVLP
jgi:Tol biopolymer transport system component